MIKFGTKAIESLYLGDKKILSAYLGENLVFNATRMYTITATIDPAGSGTVTGAGTYEEGQTVTLTATPGDDYQFSGWQEDGETVSESETYTFTAMADRTFVAAFAEIPASRLPTGYREVEYIELSDYAYFDTGIKPTYTTTAKLPFTISMDVMPLNTPASSGYFFYSNYSSGTSTITYYTLYMQFNSSRNVIGRILTGHSTTSYINAATKTVKTAVTSGTRITISAYKAATGSFVSADDTKSTISNTGSYGFTSSMNNIYLFYRGSSTSYLNGRIYSCQIDYGGTLKRDYVPCVNPSGVAGLYDLVSDTFLAHTVNVTGHSGTVTAGPAV